MNRLPWDQWLPPGDALRLLDIGCGTAEEAGALIASGRVRDFLGVDLDEEAIVRARARWRGTRFVCADAARLRPEHVGLFDVILLRRPDLLAQPGRWRAVFARLPALLSSGGRVIVTVIDEGEALLARRWLEEAGLCLLRVEPLPEPEERILLVGGFVAPREVAFDGRPVNDGDADGKAGFVPGAYFRCAHE